MVYFDNILWRNKVFIYFKLYNGFSDDMVYNLINTENGLRRYRFLKPSDYMYRDEKTDEVYCLDIKLVR